METVELETKRLILRIMRLEDIERLRAFTERNSKHLERWNPTFRSFSFEEQVQASIKEYQEDKGVRFLLFRKEAPEAEMIGMCNFRNIIRGAFQACYLGYMIDHAFEGQGFMFEALQASIVYMFEKKNLHRIMANYMPANTRSARLLSALGFQQEGYAKAYLHIAGQWEDHILTARLNPSWISKD